MFPVNIRQPMPHFSAANPNLAFKMRATNSVKSCLCAWLLQEEGVRGAWRWSSTQFIRPRCWIERSMASHFCHSIRRQRIVAQYSLDMRLGVQQMRLNIMVKILPCTYLNSTPVVLVILLSCPHICILVRRQNCIEYQGNRLLDFIHRPDLQ
jgi:hypothetical protein